jgi:DNA adenine methylase
MDPPYFEKGYMLYKKYFNKDDHLKLQKYLKNELKIRWILSYDDVEFINVLYKGRNKNGFCTNHFAHKAKVGRELIILSDNCAMPCKKNKSRSKYFKWN